MSDISPDGSDAIGKKYWKVLMLTAQKLERQPGITIGAAFQLAKTEAGFEEIPAEIENMIVSAAYKIVLAGGATAVVTAVRSAVAEGVPVRDAALAINKGEQK